MKMSPRKERDYLMEPKVRLTATMKAKKKSIRKDNILKGRKPPAPVQPMLKTQLMKTFSGNF